MFAIEDMTARPVLIADAGFMYMAKMSGNAANFDLFTPDTLPSQHLPHRWGR
jgi:hypothetical protein